MQTKTGRNHVSDGGDVCNPRPATGFQYIRKTLRKRFNQVLAALKPKQFSFQSTGYAGANTLSCIWPYFQPWSSEPRSRRAGEFPSLQTGRKRRLHGADDKNDARVSSTMAFRQAQDRAHNITPELIISGKLPLTRGHICLLQVNHFLPA